MRKKTIIEYNASIIRISMKISTRYQELSILSDNPTFVLLGFASRGATGESRRPCRAHDQMER